LCPPKNAYESYDTILETTLRHAGDRLVIIALGQTATVLAYDLAAKGLQALDLGHIDVEYEWYRMGVTEKTAIPSKAVNEVSGIEFGDVDDPDYKSQIIAKI
ncbi:MAG: GT-D fold domain-containing protein, partial [Muribaculaceae bacterium]|nr:GT-D fold domain-containing protein [Muribaculaceae bacterium]